MSLTIHDYYLSQPACMRQIFADRKALTGQFAGFYSETKPDRIYLVGSGSSMNACMAAEDFISHVLDIEVVTVPPSRPLIVRGKNPLIIAVSQGGKSSNTVAFLQNIRGQGHSIASFTSGLNVPVAEAADIRVDIAVGEETVGPKTRGYTGTVLCLYLAALETGIASGLVSKEDYNYYVSLIDETIGYAEANLKKCHEFYLAHLGDLKNARHYLFVGKGCAAAVGAEDALKVLETLCYPSAGYEFEEYLHGPACCTDEGTALFLFYSNDADGPRMEKLAQITSKATKNCYIIDSTSSIKGDNVLNLCSGKSIFMSPFTDVFFGQLISAVLTGELGRKRHEAVKEIFSDMNTKVTGNIG